MSASTLPTATQLTRASPFSSKNIQECRCGAATCRGVLGPRVSRDKEPKDALAPLTQPVSAKRKLAQAAGSLKRRRVASEAAGKAASKAVTKAIGKAAGKAVARAAPRVTQSVRVVQKGGPRVRKAVVAVRSTTIRGARAVKRTAGRQTVVARARAVGPAKPAGAPRRAVSPAKASSRAEGSAPRPQAAKSGMKQTTLSFARRSVKAVAA